MSENIMTHKDFKKVLKFYNNDEFAAKTWATKYGLINDDIILTPQDAWEILSEELETKYISKEEIFNALKGFKFIPGGRILHGILRIYYARKKGEKLNLTLSNCLYSGGPEDSMESIMEFAYLHAHVLKYGYGNGMNLNNLRPSGCPVNNAARTTAGVVPFANLYSEITNTIGHAGRRGATIIFLDCTHPDVIDFIKSKTKDEKYISGANISVMITDKFMRAVEEDSKWELTFKNDKVSMVKECKAKEIFDLICKNAWDWAEPGVIFKDRMIDYNPGCFHEESTPEGVNPCLTGDTLISVADGRGSVNIKQLSEENRDVPVYSLNKETGCVEIKMGRNPRLTGRNKKILKVTLDDGSSIRCTENHKFITRDFDEIEAKDLKFGHSLFISCKSILDKKSYWIVNKINSEKYSTFEHRYIYQFYNKLDNDIFLGKEKMVVHHIDENSRNNDILNLKLMRWSDHNSYHITKNNPMQVWWSEADENVKNEYRKKMSDSTGGIKNGRAINVTIDEHKNQIKQCLFKYGGPITKREWKKFARDNDYCKNSEIYKTYDLIDELNYEIFGYKKEWSKKGYYSLLSYRDYIKNKDNSDLKLFYDTDAGKCYCIKICEECGKEFIVTYHQRERCFCSLTCSCRYFSKIYQRHAAKKSAEKFSTIYNEFVDYAIELDKLPSMDEWSKHYEIKFEKQYDRNYYSYEGLIKKLKREFLPEGIHNWASGKFTWSAIKDEVISNLNHKVVSVEFDGYEDVYNITVDDNHNIGIVLEKFEKKNGNYKYYSVYTPQCGELTLSRKERCCLGSVMLDKFYKDGSFDFDGFKSAVRSGVLILNSVTDYELKNDLFALPEIKQKAIDFRRIGLGISALADILGLLKLGYNTDEETIAFTKKLFETFRTSSYLASQNLSAEHGITIKDFDSKKYYSCKFFDDFDIPKDKNIANVTVNTIAPTGTLSIIGGGIYDEKNNKMIYSNCSSGIEPVFMRTYTRKTNISGKQEIFDIWHNAIKYAKDNGIVTEENDIKHCFPQAYEVNWRDRVKLQGIIQKYIDNSISSTVNLGNHITADEVKELYMLSWKSGCKGITVYRSGCKREGILNDANPKKEEKKLKNISRPDKLHGFTEKLKFPKYDAFITMNFKDDIPLELFLNVGKSGSELGCYTEAIGRLVSLCLSYHIPVNKIIAQMENIASDDATWHKFSKKPILVTSVVDAIAKLLKFSVTKENNIVSSDGMQICPKCNEKTLTVQEGCVECLSCGYSKCS